MAVVKTDKWHVRPTEASWFTGVKTQQKRPMTVWDRERTN